MPEQVSFWQLQKHIGKMLEIFLHFQNVGNISAFLKCRNNSAFGNCRNTLNNARNIPAFPKCRKHCYIFKMQEQFSFWQLQKHVGKLLEIFLHPKCRKYFCIFKMPEQFSFWQLQKHIWKMLEIFLHFQNVGNIATFLKCRNNSAFDNCKNTFETAGNIPAFSFFFSFLIYFGGCLSKNSIKIVVSWSQ